ncbi:hypothetical protein B0H13DRAFT_2358350 [Mycena leptocephala]|nr:hypothetical protein B0H13DRAFT_2358350 [Mycena leptocephala]
MRGMSFIIPPPRHCAHERPTRAAQDTPHLHESTATLQAHLHRAHDRSPSTDVCQALHPLRTALLHCSIFTIEAVLDVAWKAIHNTAPGHDPALDTTPQG